MGGDLCIGKGMHTCVKYKCVWWECMLCAVCWMYVWCMWYIHDRCMVYIIHVMCAVTAFGLSETCTVCVYSCITREYDRGCVYDTCMICIYTGVWNRVSIVHLYSVCCVGMWEMCTQYVWSLSVWCGTYGINRTHMDERLLWLKLEQRGSSYGSTSC